ncbi:MAG: ABC transporter permease [Saccharofermentanales bacterium]
MTLAKIALNNLLRRKSKMVFILLSLAIGISTIISIYSIVEAMKSVMAKQMAEYGANIIITAKAGEITFSYGGINIPEILFDVEKLSAADVASIGELPSGGMVRAFSPKLLGTLQTNGFNMIIAGTDIQSDFLIKPWLRLRNVFNESTDAFENLEPVSGGSMNGAGGSGKKMDLTREVERLDLDETKVLMGSAIAKTLNVIPGDILMLKGREFLIAGILQQNGSPEDNQILMDISVAQSLLERPAEVTLIEVAADYTLGNEDNLISQLKSKLPDADVTSLRKVMISRNDMLTRMTRFGAAISILVLLIGMLVVGLTMTAAIHERTREIGIFRAIGFRKSHITKIILLEGIIVSAIGGIAGFIIGITAAKILGPYLSDSVLQVSWRFDLLLPSIAIAIAIGTIASVFPARQASGLDPVTALRFI